MSVKCRFFSAELEKLDTLKRLGCVAKLLSGACHFDLARSRRDSFQIEMICS
jgi:hypothetical protein